jgi:hypothetical protein
MDLFIGEGGGVLQGLADIFGFKKRILLRDLFDRHAVGDEAHKQRNANPHAPNTRSSSEDLWIECNPFVSGHGRSSLSELSLAYRIGEIQTSTKPVIDWTEVDSHREQNKKSIVGASAQKASWLQRSLFQLGRADVKPHDHGIEVTLPGKKK